MNDEIDPTPPLGCQAAILCAAAIVGVIVDVMLWQLRPTVLNVANGLPATWLPLSFFILCVIAGSFLAIPICLAVGLPLWRLAQRWRRHSLTDALAFGVIAGAIIGIGMALPEIDAESPWLGIDRGHLFDFIDYCVAGLCAGWVAHRLGYPRP